MLQLHLLIESLTGLLSKHIFLNMFLGGFFFITLMWAVADDYKWFCIATKW